MQGVDRRTHPGAAAGHRRRGRALMASFSTYLSFVRISHTVFALPFALTGALLAAWSRPVRVACSSAGSCVCMVSARQAAMGFNRLVDARFDAREPAHRRPRAAARRDDAARRGGLRRRMVGGVRGGGVPDSARCAAGCRRWRWPSCSGTRWPSATPPTRKCFSAWRMAVAPVGGWLAAGGARRLDPVAARPGHWPVGRRVRHHLCLPGCRRSIARRA